MDRDKALFHVEEMIRDGADIIDIGGESTRPGYERISDEEEIDRISPVIESVKASFDIPVSVDTYKPAVALEAVRQGADLVNDIWGLKSDAKMAEVIAQTKAAVCIMHNSEIMLDEKEVTEGVMRGLEESVEIAQKAGIEKERIMLDIGIGFAKDTRGNLRLLKDMDRFIKMGYPFLLGASRKSVIGNTLNLPKDERDEATCSLSVLAVMAGFSFVRVHNIKANKRAIDMAEAVLYV